MWQSMKVHSLRQICSVTSLSGLPRSTMHPSSSFSLMVTRSAVASATRPPMCPSMQVAVVGVYRPVGQIAEELARHSLGWDSKVCCR